MECLLYQSTNYKHNTFLLSLLIIEATKVAMADGQSQGGDVSSFTATTATVSSFTFSKAKRTKLLNGTGQSSQACATSTSSQENVLCQAASTNSLLVYSEHKFAILRPLVKQMLSAPASSTSSERVFIQAGLISPPRLRQLKELLSAFVFFKCNVK